MKKTLRYSTYAIGVLLLLLVTLYFTVTVFYKKEIIHYVLTAVNKQLATKATVKEVDISFWEHFPKVAVEFKEVVIVEVSPVKTPENLLKAERILLAFNIWDIIQKKYTVKQLAIKNARINIKRFKNGVDNYHFWKTSNATDTSSFSLQLDKIHLVNTRLQYNDESTDLYLNTLLKDVYSSGKFNDKEYMLLLKGSMQVKTFDYNKINYVSNQLLKLNTQFNVAQNKIYTFNQTSIQLADVKLLLNGLVNTSNVTSSAIDLTISGDELNIKSALSLLPSQWSKKYKQYKSEGLVNGLATIKGISSVNETPSIHVSFETRDASLKVPDVNVRLTHIKLKGSYNDAIKNGKQESMLRLDNFDARLNEGAISGSLSINDLSNPFLIANLSANIDLNALQQLVKVDTIATISGNTKALVHFKGKLKDNYSTQDLKSVSIDGNLQLTNTVLKLKGDNRSLHHVNGRFEFNNNDIVINELLANINSSDIDLKGTFKNIVPFILLDNEDLTIDADLQSNKIDLNDFFKEETTAKGNEVYEVKLPEKVNFVFNTTIKQLKLNKFDATEVSGKIILQNKKITTPQLNFKTMEGSIVLKGFVDGTQAKIFDMFMDVQAQRINMSKLFFELNNFSQDYITDKHLKGSLTTDLQFKSRWNERLEPLLGNLECTANTTIEKGELINFEPLLNLSKFVEVSELKHIKFSTLQNQISIKDRTIFIPQMEIKSNALNITASGKHSFDNVIDYHFKVLLNDLLAQKARKKKENEEFGEIEDDGLGKITLFISMTGTTDNPKISYDRRGLRQKLKEDIQKEKQNIKSLLKEEFGFFKKDSAIHTKPKKTQQQIGVSWNENKTTTKEEDKKNINDKKATPKDKKTSKFLKPNKKEEKDNSDDFN